MSVKSKLITLELLSGIFGWIAIISGLGLITALIAALFFDWSWWNPLYCLLGSGVGRWLARGFMDSKNRVAFEAAMIEQGSTPEEAGKAWLDAHLGDTK